MGTMVRIIIAIAFLTTSCVTQKRCMTKFPVEKKTEVIIKDTIIYVPVQELIIEKDTVSIVDTIPCLITTSKESKGKRSQVKYSLDKGVLKIKCECDSIKIERDSLAVRLQRAEIKISSFQEIKPKCRKPYELWLLVFVLGIGHIARSYNRIKKRFKFLP